MLIKKSALRTVVGDDYRIDADFFGELDAHVMKHIERAKERASANGRRTLKPQDI